jgi:hypothetical protein
MTAAKGMINAITDCSEIVSGTSLDNVNRRIAARRSHRAAAVDDA